MVLEKLFLGLWLFVSGTNLVHVCFSLQDNTFEEYVRVMEQWQDAQAKCSKTIVVQKKKIEAFKDSLSRWTKDRSIV